jgi:hypothetical protein
VEDHVGAGDQSLQRRRVVDPAADDAPTLGFEMSSGSGVANEAGDVGG